MQNTRNELAKNLKWLRKNALTYHGRHKLSVFRRNAYEEQQEERAVFDHMGNEDLLDFVKRNMKHDIRFATEEDCDDWQQEVLYAFSYRKETDAGYHARILGIRKKEEALQKGLFGIRSGVEHVDEYIVSLEEKINGSI